MIGGRDEFLKRRCDRRAIDIHRGLRDHERDLERSRIQVRGWSSECDLGDEVGVLLPACCCDAGGFETSSSGEVGRVGAGSEGEVLEQELTDLCTYGRQHAEGSVGVSVLSPGAPGEEGTID